MKLVVLTDETGTALSTAEIVDAHTGAGQLHTAFSVFIFRNDGTELLIQQRSADKMLFAGKWANSCCSHPLPGEDVIKAGQRRLQEELGFSCPLHVADSFTYRAEDGSNGVEHEYDTVLIGHVEDDVQINVDPDEIADWRWVTLTNLHNEMESEPEKFAPWFAPALQIVEENNQSMNQ